MNTLDTLQVQDASGVADLSGTRIVADKIIGVFSGRQHFIMIVSC